jgi:hypothetical protein
MATNKLGQVKELLALTVLGLLSSLSASLLLKEASGGFVSQQSNVVIRAYYDFSNATHRPLNALAVVVVPSLWLLALSSHHRKIPRAVLDCFGGFFVLRMVIGLLFVNALLFTPATSQSLLLGQILAFLPFFVVAWGWLIWRIDYWGREVPQRIIAIPDENEPITSFDYYHASIYSIINQGKSGFKGVTRLGRSLCLVHNLMLINLLGLALARAYGLVQKML